MKLHLYIIIFLLLCLSCHKHNEIKTNTDSDTTIQLIVLGNVQDAGSPQIGCTKACCKDLFRNPKNDRLVTSLGLINKNTNTTYLFEATPNISQQMKLLSNYSNNDKQIADGIFLTHAHIGHYSGLMYLGKEATNAKNVKVFTMPRMQTFLENNGPWGQLVKTKNIKLSLLENEKVVQLSKQLSVTPFLVPHRDEYSETVGYKIKGATKTALFIPDIDKWDKWTKNIVNEIKNVDYAFLDATFFDGVEINNRDINEIPHPFVIESFKTFDALDATDKKKIYFIHFNHTNPLLNPESKEAQLVLKKGFNIARLHDVFDL